MEQIVCIFGLIVIDGDGIRCNDQLMRFERYDAPEIARAECELEAAAGRLARLELAEIMIRDRAPIFTTGETCGHGRPCIIVIGPDGADAGATLAQKGLAARRICDREDGCKGSQWKDSGRDWCAG